MRSYIFRVIYLSLVVGGARKSETEIQNLVEFMDWPYLFTEIYALP